MPRKRKVNVIYQDETKIIEQRYNRKTKLYTLYEHTESGVTLLTIPPDKLRELKINMIIKDIKGL